MHCLRLFAVQMRQDGETKAAVLAALKAGYRMIDTARNYENEAEVNLRLSRFVTHRKG